MTDKPVQVIWYGSDGEEKWRSEIPTPSPRPGWRFERVAAVGFAEPLGGRHAWTWSAERKCGCIVNLMYRLDTRKQAFLSHSCGSHEEEMSVAYQKLKTRVRGNIMDSFVERLEKEIGD